jgi:hypothetical protein
MYTALESGVCVGKTALVFLATIMKAIKMEVKQNVSFPATLATYLWHNDAVGPAVPADQLLAAIPAEPHLFFNFSHVCPEPVLGNIQFSA